MGHYLYVVLCNPVPGREDEFNDWYTHRHLDDVMREAGFSACQRFRSAEMAAPQRAPKDYLALYEIETDDIDAVDRAMRAAVGRGAIPISDALDVADITAWYVEAITERRRSAPEAGGA
jgi:hypothetical protein